MSTRIEQFTQMFSRGENVPVEQVEEFFGILVAEDHIEPLIALFEAWDQKDFSESELFHLAKVMRMRMRKVPSKIRSIDIVGTGGSRSKTFNVSTAAALVASGAGLPVAKHGNRAATSRSGSADVLEQLGVKVSISVERAAECLEKTGLAFLFAPDFHELSPTLAKARRIFGRPTIFNYLGPLCNPARPVRSVLGVSSSSKSPMVARVCQRLGFERSLVICGETGLDEIGLRGATDVHDVLPIKVAYRRLSRVDFGLMSPAGTLESNCDAKRSAEIIKSLVKGELAFSPEEEIVAMNAAAAISLYDDTQPLTEAYATAVSSIRKGAASMKLDQLIAATNAR